MPKNLAELIETVKTGDAELGLAFDGDGDRLGVVTKDGEIIFADRQLMLLAKDVLSRNPGARDHLRREVHPPARALDRAARRQAADLEDRPLADQGEAARRPARCSPARCPATPSSRSAGTASTTRFTAAPGCSRSCRRRRTPTAVLKSLPNAPSTPELHWRAGGRRAARPGGKAAGGEAVPRRRAHAHHRRRARGVRRRLRPGARLEHHAGDRAALRSGHGRRAGAHQEGLPQRRCSR